MTRHSRWRELQYSHGGLSCTEPIYHEIPDKESHGALDGLNGHYRTELDCIIFIKEISICSFLDSQGIGILPPRPKPSGPFPGDRKLERQLDRDDNDTPTYRSQ